MFSKTITWFRKNDGLFSPVFSVFPFLHPSVLNGSFHPELWVRLVFLVFHHAFVSIFFRCCVWTPSPRCCAATPAWTTWPRRLTLSSRTPPTSTRCCRTSTASTSTTCRSVLRLRGALLRWKRRRRGRAVSIRCPPPPGAGVLGVPVWGPRGAAPAAGL